MINNLLNNDENIKDKLLKLSLREIRLEAKKLSINLYSRKTKKELVELLLKDQKKLLIENNYNDDVVAEEDWLDIEKTKEEEERIALEKAKEKKRGLLESKAKKRYLEKQNKEKIYNLKQKKNLKRLLSKPFPNKKITVTDNKSGFKQFLLTNFLYLFVFLLFHSTCSTPKTPSIFLNL